MEKIVNGYEYDDLYLNELGAALNYYNSNNLEWKKEVKKILKDKLPEDFDEIFLDETIKNITFFKNYEQYILNSQKYNYDIKNYYVVNVKYKNEKKNESDKLALIEKAIIETRLPDKVFSEYYLTKNDFLNKLEQMLKIMIKLKDYNEENFDSYLESNYIKQPLTLKRIAELKKINLLRENKENNLIDNTVIDENNKQGIEDIKYNKLYEETIEDAVIDFFTKNPNKKFKYKNEYLNLKDISKNVLKDKLPKDYDENFLDSVLQNMFDNQELDKNIKNEDLQTKLNILKVATEKADISGILMKYLVTQNNFLNKLESNLNDIIDINNIDKAAFNDYLTKKDYLSFEKIANLKAQNLKREVEKSRMPQNTEEEKLVYKVLNERFSKKNIPILPKIVVPEKTEKEIEEDIKEDIEDLKDLSRLENIISDRFYAYVLVRFGKTKEDLLTDMNEKINHSNLYRKAYNEEIDKDMIKKNTLYQKDYIYDERGMVQEKLVILPELEELPKDYYLKSIYTEEFFNAHEKDRFLVTQIEELKKEEKRKEKEEQELKNRLHTYKLILKHRLGYSNNEINDMDDKTVFSIIEEAKDNGVFDKEQEENENHRIRRS